MFDFVHDTPLAVGQMVIGLIVSSGLAIWKHERSLIDIAMGASALLAIAYVVFETAAHGIGPLYVIGFGFAFGAYLPLSFVTGLACRLAMRRTLRVFRGAPGVDEPRPRKSRSRGLPLKG